MTVLFTHLSSFGFARVARGLSITLMMGIAITAWNSFLTLGSDKTRVKEQEDFTGSFLLPW